MTTSSTPIQNTPNRSSWRTEMRWHPLLGEWVIVTPGRQDRPLLPSQSCPFCPDGEDGKGRWDVKALPNKYSAFVPNAELDSKHDSILYKKKAAEGVCEVVLYTKEHSKKLYELGSRHVKKIIDVFIERHSYLASLPFVKYVLIFENRGKAVGVTNTHPHCQIYGLPFIPPLVRKEIRSSKQYYKSHGECLFCRLAELEGRSGKTVIFENDGFIAFLPFFGRWPYETHIYPRRHVQSLTEIDDADRSKLAEALIDVVTRFDSLFGFELPYMMVFHSSPTGSATYPYYHFHIELWPIQRARDKLKFTAVAEHNGIFLNDVVAEEKAHELRNINIFKQQD